MTGADGTAGPAGMTGPQGPQGLPGSPGFSPTVTALLASDPQCPTGGAAVSTADGGTVRVCNGATGAPGQAGAQGQPGPQGAQGLAGLQGAQGQQGLQGPAGNPGAAGAPGDLRIYGDGSAGSRTVSNLEAWAGSGVIALNLQFQNFTVNPGATLTVPSGTVIRVAGVFQNNGTIRVLPWGGGGRFSFYDEPVRGVPGAFVLSSVIVRPPGLGIALHGQLHRGGG